MQALYYQDQDATRFSIEAILSNIIILLCFVAGIMSDVAWYILAFVINVALVRWMLAVHELFHIQKYTQANAIVRLFLIPFSPLNLGYAEYRSLHMDHHKNTANPDDPDAFHIRGGHFRSFLGAFFFPEGSTINYLKKGSEPVKWIDVSFRVVLFIGIAVVGGSAFWMTWVILRVNYAIAIWIFFHHLHYRQGDYGTFALPLPSLLKKYFQLVYGKPALMATMHHDIHHQFPRVAAIYLDQVRPLPNTTT